MRYAKPPVPTLRSSSQSPVMLRAAALTAALCVTAGSAIAGATYSYDALGRIISVRYDDGKQIVYKYDAAGNRTQHIVSATTVNRPPVAVADAITLTEDQSSVTFNPRTNDTDPDGNPLTLFSAMGGGYGTSALSGGNSTVTYSSTHKRNATDKFVYTINDGQDMEASGEVTVTLANLNPTVVNDSPTTAKNVPLNFDPRTNDSDPGGDAFTITAKSTPAHGTVTIGSGGTSLNYTPTTNYAGPDSFTYTVTDVDGGASTGTVSVTVTHGINPPNAIDDNSGVMGGQTRTFDPRLNDTDDGGAVTITAKTNGAHGTVTINSGTSVSFAAQTGWTGNDTFTYTITDGDGMTDTATVSMSVSATNRAPTAVADTMAYNGTWVMGQSTPFKPSISIDPRWNDTDPDGHALTVTAKTNGTLGGVVKSGNTLTWTKTTNVMGPGTWNDSFTYTISDGNGGTSVGTVSVVVTLECVDGPQQCGE